MSPNLDPPSTSVSYVCVPHRLITQCRDRPPLFLRWRSSYQDLYPLFSFEGTDVDTPNVGRENSRKVLNRDGTPKIEERQDWSRRENWINPPSEILTQRTTMGTKQPVAGLKWGKTDQIVKSYGLSRINEGFKIPMDWIFYEPVVNFTNKVRGRKPNINIDKPKE